MTTRRIIKIVVLLLVLALLVGGGIWLWKSFGHKAITGKIEFGTIYHLRDYYLGDNTEVNIAGSYFKVNTDQKTGEIYLDGYEDGLLNFIVTEYKEGTSNTILKLEYIYKNTLYQLQAESNNTEIRFKTTRKYQVNITQENPEDISYLEYNSTIFIFTKEVDA